MPAQSARIVIVSSGGRVALIRRRRGGREYWSFPGGGIKRGETPHRAARREVAEELGLDVRPERLLVVASGHALFLATIDDEPPLRMRGPEVARRSQRHRYRPQWLPLDQLTELDIRPRMARVALVHLTGTTAPAELDHEGPDLAGRPDAPIEEIAAAEVLADVLEELPADADGIEETTTPEDSAPPTPAAPETSATPSTAAPEDTAPASAAPETTSPEASTQETTTAETTTPEPTAPGDIAPRSDLAATTDSATTEPEITEPQTTEPQTTEPQTTEPQTTEPQTTEPQTTEPDTTAPESTATPSEGVPARPGARRARHRPGRWARAWHRVRRPWRRRAAMAGRPPGDPPSDRP